MTTYYMHDKDGQIWTTGFYSTCPPVKQKEEWIYKEGDATLDQYLDIKTNKLIDIPEKPSPSHEWSWTTKKWTINLELAWDLVRVERNKLIAESDFVLLPDVPYSEELRAEWVTYRQALRDVTLQEDPTNIVWPQPPVN